MNRRPVDYLYDRVPWDGGPQGQVSDSYPIPGTRRLIRPGIGAPVNPAAPAAGFPVPQWVAQANAYAYCTQQTFAYTTTSGGAAVLLAPVTYRNLLALRNLSTVETVAIAFGTAANGNAVYQLPPESFMQFDGVVPQDDMYIQGVAGAGTLAVVSSTVYLPAIPVPGP